MLVLSEGWDRVIEAVITAELALEAEISPLLPFHFLARHQGKRLCDLIGKIIPSEVNVLIKGFCRPGCVISLRRGRSSGAPFIEGNSQSLQKGSGTKGDPSCRTHTGVGDAELVLFPGWKERKNPGKSAKRPNVGFWLKAEQCFPSWLKFGVMSLAWLCEKRENDLKTFSGGFGETGSGSVNLQEGKWESFRETFSQTSARCCCCLGGSERNF